MKKVLINKKEVYVVRHHHHVLLAWAFARRRTEVASHLITFDHHTDTHSAFRHHTNGHPLGARGVAACEEIKWASTKSIKSAIKLLRHDEHISAAVRSGILSASFSIQLSDPRGTASREEKLYFEDKGGARQLDPPEPLLPFTYDVPSDRMFVIPFSTTYRPPKEIPPENTERARVAQILESTHLDSQLARAAPMAESVGIQHLEATPYIVDIDLDVFHSEQAINPQDPCTFYRLVKNAEIITIATEPGCVKNEWLFGKRLSAKQLLARMMNHLEIALH